MLCLSLLCIVRPEDRKVKGASRRYRSVIHYIPHESFRRSILSADSVRCWNKNSLTSVALTSYTNV